MRPLLLAVLLIGCGLLPLIGFGQQNQQKYVEVPISGRLVNQANEPISNSTVSVVPIQSGAAGIYRTDEDGRFNVASVFPPQHKLEFKAPGYKPRTVELSEEEKGQPIDLGSIVLLIREVTVVPLQTTEPPQVTGEPITTVCEIAAVPEKFNGKRVVVSGDIRSPRKSSPMLLSDKFCSTVQVPVVMEKIGQNRTLGHSLKKPATAHAKIIGTFRLKTIRFGPPCQHE
jgi:hypothetical protein